jgi:hypothetical protein
MIPWLHEYFLLQKDKKVQVSDTTGDAIKNYSRYHKN